jgi:hypothetical protein
MATPKPLKSDLVNSFNDVNHYYSIWHPTIDKKASNTASTSFSSSSLSSAPSSSLDNHAFSSLSSPSSQSLTATSSVNNDANPGENSSENEKVSYYQKVMNCFCDCFSKRKQHNS